MHDNRQLVNEMRSHTHSRRLGSPYMQLLECGVSALYSKEVDQSPKFSFVHQLMGRWASSTSFFALCIFRQCIKSFGWLWPACATFMPFQTIFDRLLKLQAMNWRWCSNHIAVEEKEPFYSLADSWAHFRSFIYFWTAMQSSVWQKRLRKA